jgi:hypothetical protein
MLEQAESTTSTTTTPTADAHPTPAGTPRPSEGLDVTLLADKVYRLLLAELRLSLARGERLARPGAPRGTRA